MPFLRPRYFPKQLFFRFLLQQASLIPLVFLALLALRAYVAISLVEHSEPAQFLFLVDRGIAAVALLTAGMILGIALWSGYRLVLPLGRILVKARSIQRREYQAREEDTDGLEEPSEWSDLESMLHKIGREMQSKDTSISRERRQVEAVMSALTEAVAAVDKTGTLLFHNTRFAILFGQGKKDSRLSDFLRSPDVLEAFRETLKDATPRQVSTQLRLRNENSPRHFSLSIAPLRQENDSLYGAIGVFHDITELRHMDQVRIDFVANVSHELRSPLTSIKGYAQTLKMDLSEESASRKFLDTIERNTDRLIALTHDLLNLSSLESGVELEQEEIRLEDLTNRVLAQVENQRAAKQHQIISTVSTPLLCADPKRIEQVMVNLIENSIKYVPAGGKIGVEWALSGGAVQLRVFDDGPGIPPEHHSRVFERFYRVDSSRARDQGGTGLGLAIVKHIMQRHGGKVIVRTNPAGRGAEFICTFPLGKES